MTCRINPVTLHLSYMDLCYPQLPCPKRIPEEKMMMTEREARSVQQQGRLET